MADYWKSQPKKFCDYCKCWIADNKPSIEFHERGKNHKENVAKKISEIKKKSLEKAKEEEKMSKEFAAMEEAAMKAYQEDLKRLGAKAEPVGQSSTPKKLEEKKEKKEKRKKEKTTMSTSSDETKGWVHGFSPEGYIYYYNTLSGESQWEKPEEFQDNPQESQMAAQWIEGESEDGRTYYYNTKTGVSTWERPDGFVSPANENSQDKNHAESSEAELKEADSDSGKGGSKGELQKPKRNFRRKTESDEEVEEKPRRRKKISPYGEWQEVKRESIDQEDTVTVPQEIPQAASKATKPYGEWEEITEEEDPYEKVDLELPGTDSDSLPAPVLEVPEDAKVIFKEKTVTLLGDTTAGIPVFKKRKFENGKSRNIRQRLNDH
ncbi:WW domain-binding protein 4 isoform X3 [Hemicordylus capensis]|uniref:WW domain-binding protein 4 isoform X2 n=1 Tax=Hemicordylus capensis TaxID=884348 RepID=UPI0023024382|nr:WW domain-binding protein 4 isoform X2 [Hemicordylus capensis]XP_053163391.1 WW domain-binding protein 4 isoform X3 [Hemicordylus capensis]